MLQCPYCEEDAETCGHWDSFGDCRFYLGKVAPMISDLKARVAEGEEGMSKKQEINHDLIEDIALNLIENDWPNVGEQLQEYVKRNREIEAENDTLKARVAELEAAHQWRPIETAPEDVVVLGCEGNWLGPVMCYGDNGWIDDEGETCHPTHWMPLPEAPK